MSIEASQAQATGAAGMVLLALCAGQFLMALDSSVMNVSIATVADDLGTTVTGIQSAIVLYTLVMAMLMVTGGKIGSIIGRKRAFTIGLVIYCSGSLTTALSPNLGVLLFGWSLLEGIGAALIMPAIVALVAGNFPPEGRPRAYGLVGAAGAIAIAVGPLIGGLATTYASWRWVFAGEVIVGAGIILFGRRIADAPVEVRPHLDLLGSLLWALGMGLAIFGVLRSSEWGWLLADEGAPSLLGMSPVVWFILGGLVAIRLFMLHIRRLEAAGGEPLVTPSLFANEQMTGGLVMFFFQFVVMMGLFFVIPLYLSVALGLSAIDTGIKITPLSITMLLAAAGIPRFFPTASPRRVVELSLVAAVIGIVVLFSAMDVDASAEIVTGPLHVDRAGHGRARVAAGERHRLGGPRRGEPRGGRPPEHGHAVRRVARHGACRLGPDRLVDGLVLQRDRPEPGRAAGGRRKRTWNSRPACRSSPTQSWRRRWRTRGSTRDHPGHRRHERAGTRGRPSRCARAPRDRRRDRAVLHEADPDSAARHPTGRLAGRRVVWIGLAMGTGARGIRDHAVRPEPSGSERGKEPACDPSRSARPSAGRRWAPLNPQVPIPDIR